MDNTIKALQNLYVALGGELTDTYETIAGGVPVSGYVIIPDMINAIAALVTSGVTKELPTVSAEDNGSVLKVVDGEWAVGEDAIE